MVLLRQSRHRESPNDYMTGHTFGEVSKCGSMAEPPMFLKGSIDGSSAVRHGLIDRVVWLLARTRISVEASTLPFDWLDKCLNLRHLLALLNPASPDLTYTHIHTLSHSNTRIHTLTHLHLGALTLPFLVCSAAICKVIYANWLFDVPKLMDTCVLYVSCSDNPSAS